MLDQGDTPKHWIQLELKINPLREVWMQHRLNQPNVTFVAHLLRNLIVKLATD